jgi:phosphoglycolate phosphatase
MGGFDLIVFDYDGTLCDTRPAIVHCIKRIFIAHRMVVPDDEVILHTIGAGIALQETFARLAPGLGRDIPALQTMMEAYRAAYREESEQFVSMFENVKETLAELNRRRVDCAIVSNKGFQAIRHSIESLVLAPYVALIVGEQPGVPQKPNPAVLNDHVIPKFPGIDRSRILMLGDTEADIQFARNAGIKSCWAAYGYGHEDKCRALSPDYRISKIREVLSL